MTVPPNALAFVGIVFGAWLAAWTGRRASLIIGSAVVAIIGTCDSFLQGYSRSVSPPPFAGYIVLLTTTTRTLFS
jgi:MFS family permease